MQDQYVIMDRGFKNVRQHKLVTGYQLQVRIPYYRGVFLSLVHQLDLAVDDRPIPATDLEIELAGRRFSVDQMMEADDVRWEYGAPAILKVKCPGGLSPGRHTVWVGIVIRKSYIPPEDPEHLYPFAWHDGTFHPYIEPPTVSTRQMTLVQ